MICEALTKFGSPLQRIERPTPVPKGTEVLIRTRNAGVCHSDVHLQDGSFDLGGGNKLALEPLLRLPHTLGHEIEGEVAGMGPEAKGVKIGERYAIFPWIGCGKCVACEREEENLCKDPRQLGASDGVWGGYSTHVLVPHPRYLLAYGNTTGGLAATYMCSGLTAFSAMKKIGKVVPRDAIVVVGVGGVGMMGVQFAKALFGRGPIVADINAGRLEVAKKAGAVASYNTKDPDAAKKLVADTDGGVYAVVDFVGSEATYAFARASLRKGGKIILVGLFGGAVTIPLMPVPASGFALIGSSTGTLAEAKEMMALVRAGKVDPIPVEARPLSEANRTLDDLRKGSIVGRVVLTP